MKVGYSLFKVVFIFYFFCIYFCQMSGAEAPHTFGLVCYQAVKQQVFSNVIMYSDTH